MMTLNQIEQQKIAKKLTTLSDKKRIALIKLLTKEGIDPLKLPIAPAIRKSNKFPLSWAQERLWFLYQLEGPNATYNDSGWLRITGDINYDALKSAIVEIGRRHEVLRTRFQEDNGTSVQIVEPELNFQFEVNDWQNLSPTQQQTDLQKYARQEAAKPFNLTTGHLLRVSILKFSATESILLVTMHHIIIDAWSFGVFIKEFSALYTAYSQGKSSPLTELPIQYADYSIWQRQWLSEEILENLISYWRQQLAGAPPTLELPFKKEDTGVRSGQSKVESFTVSPTITEKLQALSRQQGVTLFMTLLAAWQTLLYRYTNSDDIVVGTDIANRNRAETESLIGFFVNLLVIRTNLSGNPTFKELLKRVQEVTLGAYAHQDLPFAKLVDVLRPERKNNTTPLFQVLFVFLNTPKSKFELPNLTIEPLGIDNGATRFDLTIFVEETEAGITWDLRYNTDLFEQQDIAKMSGNLQTLLSNIANNPDTKIKELEMLTESEKEAQVAAKAKRTKANFKKFKSIKPKAVSLPQKDLIKTSYLQPEQTLPLVIEPNSEEVDIADWATNNREFFETNLRQHGAILFKDFNINSISKFEKVAGAISSNLFGEYGDLPREGVSKKVYGSTPYPEDKAILFHNESSHLHRWPQKIFFLCVKAAESGGDTPIVDCRKVYQMLSPQLREKLEEKQLMYVRNYVEDLDVSWQDFFHTNNKSEVETYCKNAGMEFEWLENNGLKTAKLRPAITTHPKTGEKIFFNQIQLHHISYLDAAVRESLLSEFGEKSLPRNVYYGDGSPIEDSVIEEIGAIYEKATISFPWQAGNMIMLDNMLIAHGRNPYVGERKIVVAMGELMEESEN
ncbi:condensation domain-containing protein [Dapis sp. BLCC M126]|uniref:condensation domain-containing protein n=1 Tax=Dapis sp. BLCC M126 TaxID=3400189 RepID=UPI003CF280FF